MDRNTIIGLVLIGVLLVCWSIFNQPSKEEMARQKKTQDSIALVNKTAHSQDSLKNSSAGNIAVPDSVSAQDSIKTPVAEKPNSGFFTDSTNNEEKFLTIENDLLKVTLSNLGGRVYSVELKKYKTTTGKPLILFEGKSSEFNYVFYSGTNQVNTGNIFFKTENQPVVLTGKDSATITYRAYLTAEKFIEQTYTIRPGSYMLGYHLKLKGLDSIITENNRYLSLTWKQKLLNVEHAVDDNRNYSTVYYKYPNEDAGSLSLGGAGTETKFPANVDWVSFKQHFFNSALIAPKVFEQGKVSDSTSDDNTYVKSMNAELVLAYKHGVDNNYAMNFYFGPNHYTSLKKLGIGLEEIIPMGWGIFSWFASPINKYFILPLFNFLNGFIGNYGIIILIMTLLIRGITLPLTYKSMVSASKMKVLKPEIDELKEKYKDDQGKFGQEQLKLFQKAGVNPLGGCLPLLIQLPILTAMYSLFPNAIELRMQSFLWATDLSSYDSIYNFPNHFSLPFYGDHVSLFTLLMTVTQIIMAVYTSQMNNVTGQMKWMQYVFPVMLLGIFNNLPAALTYYYFLFNVFSIIMQWGVTKFMIDEKAIHAQIQENKKKTPKKSGFMSRLEEMQKKQREAQRTRSK